MRNHCADPNWRGIIRLTKVMKAIKLIWARTWSLEMICLTSGSASWCSPASRSIWNIVEPEVVAKGQQRYSHLRNAARSGILKRVRKLFIYPPVTWNSSSMTWPRQVVIGDSMNCFHDIAPVPAYRRLGLASGIRSQSSFGTGKLWIQYQRPKCLASAVIYIPHQKMLLKTHLILNRFTSSR